MDINKRKSMALILGAGTLLAAGCAPMGNNVLPHPYIQDIPVSLIERATLMSFKSDLMGILAGTPAVVSIGESFTAAKMPEAILFDHPDTDIRGASMPLLTQISALMLRYPDVSLEILSHWSLDTPHSNSDVKAQRRAVAIQAALMSRRVEINRIVATGMGARFPIAQNSSAVGRSINRRVDLVFRAIKR